VSVILGAAFLERTTDSVISVTSATTILTVFALNEPQQHLSFCSIGNHSRQQRDDFVVRSQCAAKPL
jgi:hypothetical protein